MVKKYGYRGKIDQRHIEAVQLHKKQLKIADLQN